MISFRFHLVSLSAVFLALALGIVLGATVVDQATVNVLNGRIKQVRGEANDARGQLGVWTRFGDQAEPTIVTGRLTGVRVLVVTPENIGGDVLTNVHNDLSLAGAIDAGTLTLDDSWGDPSSKDEIAGVLGVVGPTTLDAVVAEGAERVAAEFVNGGGPTLAALAAANLVRLDAGDPAVTPGAEARILVLDNGAPAGLLEPLTRDLGTSMPARVLVADAGPDNAISTSLVGLLRHDRGDTRLTTVDHIRTPEGRIAAVLALHDFDRSVIGDYGSGPGADRAAPPTGG